MPEAASLSLSLSRRDNAGPIRSKRAVVPDTHTLMSYNIWNYNADWQARKRMIAQFVSLLLTFALWSLRRWAVDLQVHLGTDQRARARLCRRAGGQVQVCWRERSADRPRPRAPAAQSHLQPHLSARDVLRPGGTSHSLILLRIKTWGAAQLFIGSGRPRV
jgi:hypothetical protein